MSKHSSSLAEGASISAAPTSPYHLTYVFGAARSGTTWLSKIMDSHPDVLYLHEPLRLVESSLYKQAGRVAAGKETSLAVPIPELLEELISYRDQLVRPPFFRKRFSSNHWVDQIRWSAKWLTKSRARAPRLNLAQHGSLRVVLKEGLYRNALRLATTLQAHRVVLILRHPCGVVNSRLRGVRAGAMPPMSASKFFQQNQDLCEAMNYSERQLEASPPEVLMTLCWLSSYLPFADIHQHAASHMHWLTYENLVDHSHKEMERLFQACELSVHPQTLAFLDRSKQTRTSFLRSLLGKRYTYFDTNKRADDQADAWKRELTPSEVENILSVASRFPLAIYWPNVTV